MHSLKSGLIILIGSLSYLTPQLSKCQTTIWSDDFESYSDNTTIGANNNTANSDADWTIELDPGYYFRVETDQVLNGSRTFVARNTGNGISKSWTSELIDISAYENVSLSVNYAEAGTLESSDQIEIEYRLEQGAWYQFSTNGFQSDDMTGSATASETGLTGCILEIRITALNNANDEYWLFDDILVQGTAVADNSCFESASLSLSETGQGQDSDYSFTQTVGNDDNYMIEVGALVTITIPDTDMTTAESATFNGQAVDNYTESAAEISFQVPTGQSVAKNQSFTVAIQGLQNPASEDSYNANLQAENTLGGSNHSNYEYTVGPASIWFEDFENYNDNTSTAQDFNTTNPDVDWVVESDPGYYFRVETDQLLDGNRTFLARNTGNGISKSWTSEAIDISSYDNVKLEVEYIEFGTLEASDEIEIEYRLEGGAWIQFPTNGYQADDMSAPATAEASGILGCSVEIRITCLNNANDEYWAFDNIRVSSEASPTNSCFESASLSLSETGQGQDSDYSFTQTVGNDDNYMIEVGALVTITIPDTDMTTAESATFNGQAVDNYTESAAEISFQVPTGQSVAKNQSFTVAIQGLQNPASEDSYNANLQAENTLGGSNHSNYEYTVGPASIWFEDFENYNDNTSTAQDFNTTNPDVDWVVESDPGYYFRVETDQLLDGNRTFLARNTGNGISKSWTSEAIDISSYDNVKLEVEYIEFGTLEASDEIEIEYRLEGGAWIQFPTNGYQADDMSAPATAEASGILGCSVEIRITCLNNANDEYWAFDNIRVSSEASPTNSCFESASLSLSETGQGQDSDYSFTQTVGNDDNYMIEVGALVTITIPDTDMTTAESATFNGQAVDNYTESAAEISFQVPTGQSVAKNQSFTVAIQGLQNPASEDSYNANLQAENTLGGSNHSNYEYTVGPASIWFEDFENYNDNTSTAQDFNTTNPDVDWVVESDPGYYFRVETDQLLDGNRTFLARNTGNGISKSWTSEAIDISSYDNVKLEVEYIEFGTLEASDEIEIEYRLEGGAWIQFPTNGYQADDMSAPATAEASGILGCSVEIRITCLNNANDEYWAFDNIRVSSEASPTNSCFESASLSLSETGQGQDSDYSFTQTVGNDDNYMIEVGALVTITIPDTDMTTAESATFNGQAVDNYTESAAEISFQVPTGQSVAKNQSFTVAIQGLQNPASEDSYNANLQAENTLGGSNHSNYEYTVGPASIWFEDFENYNDNTSTGQDFNTTNPDVDWVVESDPGYYFRVETDQLLDGNRTFLARNTGNGISKSWTSEAIDISSYDNVKLEVEYIEFGTLEASDEIEIEYRLEGGAWIQFPTNGYQADDMSAPATAEASGILGCSVEIRITCLNNANDEYWAFDNIRVSSEASPTNSCFESASLSLSETGQGQDSDYLFTQTVGNDDNYMIEVGALVTVTIPDTDMTTAESATFNGQAVDNYTESAAEISFQVPTGQSVAKNQSFTVAIQGLQNPASEDSYNANLQAENTLGGSNHSNYEYTVGPASIWFEDFENYNDNTSTAQDFNTTNPDVDWVIEGTGGYYYRVETDNLLDGNRTFLARNTNNTEKYWQSELIDISPYDNILLEVEYFEFGNLEAGDFIEFEYRLDESSWIQFPTNGYQADDMSAPATAEASGILGCSVEIRITCLNNANDEYWAFDNIRVSSEDSPNNSCFENTTLTLDDDSPGAIANYTFEQTIVDAVPDLGIAATNIVTINLSEGNLSTADPDASTFDGVVIDDFLSQSSSQITFEAPTSVSKNMTFAIVIAGVTSDVSLGTKSAEIIAENNAGGINHYSYRVSLSPSGTYARISGDWDDPDTWSSASAGGSKCDCIPGTSTDVIIDGYTVTASTNVNINSILVQNDLTNQDAGLVINNGSSFTVAADFDLEMDDAGETSTLTVNESGTQMNIEGNMNVSSISGEDIVINLDDDATMDVTGNLTMSHNAGDDIIFSIGSNSTASTAKLTVGGIMTLDHNGASGGDDMYVIFNDNTEAEIANLHLDSDFAANGDLIFMRFNNNSRLTNSSGLEFTAIDDGISELEFNDNAQFNLAGNFVRNGGYGILDMNDNSTLILDGTSNQTWDFTTGTGTDAFSYQNVTINNTYGTAPQVTLNGDLTMAGTLTLTDGVVFTDGNTLILTSTVPTDITGFSSASFINGTIRKSIATNTSVYPLPVGTGNNPEDYQYAEFVNNNLSGVSALDVNVTTINEIGNNVDANLDPNKADAGGPIDNIHEDAQWVITPTGSVSGGDFGVRLFVDNISGLSNALDDYFTVLKRNDLNDYADWDAFDASTSMPANGDPGRIYNDGDGYAERTGFTSFSGFAIGSGSAHPLPIELISYAARIEEGEIHLEWQTGSEINNDYFTIYSSQEGHDFKELQTIKGAGNSSDVISYTFIDKNPKIGISYYQLKQTDFDGQYEFVGLVSVKYNPTIINPISVYPNPAIRSVRVKLNSHAEGEITIIDMSGVIQLRQRYSQDMELDISNLPAGAYLVRIVSGLGVSEEVLIKRR